jgi:hypothetical protein
MGERRDMTLVKNQLLLQDITRWHIVPTVTQQTVADHVYGVMVIALRICSLLPKEIGPGIDPYAVLLEALSHDMKEVGFGDKADGGKSQMQKQAEWNAMDPTHRIVRLADVLERAFTMERIAPTARGEFIVDCVLKDVDLLLSEGIFDHSDIPDEFQRFQTNTAVTKGVKAMIDEEWDWSVGR